MSTRCIKPKSSTHQAESAGYAFEVCFLSDVGFVRQDNEDRIKYIKPGDDLVFEKKGLLAILADGMGGHEGGQVASQLAVDVVSQVYFEQAGDDPLEALKTSFANANRAIHEMAGREPVLRGMGTTCTALALKNSLICFAHVGDSRLYRLQDGELTLLTVDHTIVTEMVRGSLIAPQEARNHPDRSVLTRALGTSPEAAVATSERLLPIQTGDIYLLCSDGLHDLVEDGEIQAALSSHSPHGASEHLITLAKGRGGYDNISVGILAVREADSVDKRIPVTRECLIEPP